MLGSSRRNRAMPSVKWHGRQGSSGEIPRTRSQEMETQSQSGPTASSNSLRSIILPAIRNFVIGVIVLGVLLCLLAGSFTYWQGWVFTVLFAFLTTAQGVYLAIKDPELLERRKNIAPEGESK